MIWFLYVFLFFVFFCLLFLYVFPIVGSELLAVTAVAITVATTATAPCH